MSPQQRGLEPDNRLTITVEEAARVLGISRSVAYESARMYESTGGAAGLPVLRFGRRLLVPVPMLEGLVGKRPSRLAEANTSDSEAS